MTRAVPGLVTLLALSTAGGPAVQDPPATPPDLARTHAALGGSALDSVQSFTVTGTLTRRIGSFSTQSSVDIRAVLPDQFVVITTRVVDQGPMGTFRIIEYAGLNGGEPIDVVDAPDAPMPVRIPAATPSTPDAIAAARDALLRQQRTLFVRLTLPLFARSFPSYPLELTPAGGAPGDVVTVRSADGARWLLSMDATTQLPSGLRWQGRPIVMAAASTTLRAGPGGRPEPASGPPPLPTGDPTVGIPDVEWRLEIEDYKTKDGLTWPHRFRTFVDGRLYEELRLRDYRINPTIDPKVFAPRTR